jgi:hypothetical protein
MSRTLKWVLGILGVLVVLAVIAGGVWVFQHRTQMMSYRLNAPKPNAQVTPGVPNNGQSMPIGPRGFRDNRDRPLNGFGSRGPMMGGRGRIFGFGPFGMGLFFLGGLFRLLLPLGLLALVAFLFYQLGRRSAAPAVRKEPASSEPAPNPPAEGS